MLYDIMAIDVGSLVSAANIVNAAILLFPVGYLVRVVRLQC